MPVANSTINDSFDITKLSFSVPEKVKEDSIEENIATNLITYEEESNITFKVIDGGTQRGKRYLMIHLQRQNSHYTNWRCSVRNKTISCPVTLRQTANGFDGIDGQHTHQMNPGIKISLEMQKMVIDLTTTRNMYLYVVIVAMKLKGDGDYTCPRLLIPPYQTSKSS
ncbi:hypothetical protein ACJMK2_036558 [Sinanodonta woodiana]|uniref:FLYWCH-type domain-containing protein n=1 Tax=Sinanodonta woodiana TaxID=1069815 RepID=A0ABD3WL26_SINWO